MAATVITRFPPSPTGFLHIGGARTALFNWLFAKANGGNMVLRIEDTDRERSTQEAVDAIIDGMQWLGLDWQGEPVSQALRADRHIEIANQLLESGNAYRCYCSKEELAKMREKAKAEGRPMGYDGTWRDRDESEAPEGIDPVIRFKSAKDGETVVDDQVQGKVVFQNKDLDDLIILRSDGSPTYNLSVVVDDHDMGVTHILRGVDHLTNAARQSQIYKALGWDVPVMAHIPLIHGADGAKLSKRHGAMGVDAYRAMGYLPEAMRNYLARLGWSHGDDEIFSTEQAIEWFGFDAIGKSPARFDFAKLENLNGHYIRNMDIDDLFNEFIKALPYLPENESFLANLNDETKAHIRFALPHLRDRAKNLVELMKGAAFICSKHPLQMDAKALKILKDDARAILADLFKVLSEVKDWSANELEETVKAYAEEKQLKLGKVAQPMRAALTGTNVSPGIFDVLEVLGRKESLDRIEAQAKN